MRKGAKFWGESKGQTHGSKRAKGTKGDRRSSALDLRVAKGCDLVAKRFDSLGSGVERALHSSARGRQRHFAKLLETRMDMYIGGLQVRMHIYMCVHVLPIYAPAA